MEIRGWSRYSISCSIWAQLWPSERTTIPTCASEYSILSVLCIEYLSVLLSDMVFPPCSVSAWTWCQCCSLWIYLHWQGRVQHVEDQAGRYIIGNGVTITVPGQHGGNVTMCAAIGQCGVIHHHAQLSPYNTPRLLLFLDKIKNIAEQPTYVVFWEHASFQRVPLVQGRHLSKRV